MEIFSHVLPKEISFENDSVKIKDGKVVSGILNKTIFSDEEGDLVKVIDRELGRDVIFETLKKAYALGTKYLTNRGITISVGDLDVSKKVLEEKDKIIKNAEKKTEEIIESYNNKSLR